MINRLLRAVGASCLFGVSVLIGDSSAGSVYSQSANIIYKLAETRRGFLKRKPKLFL